MVRKPVWFSRHKQSDMAVNNKPPLTILASTLAVFAFLIISATAVVWANGLRYNSQTGTFEQTVLIAISGSSQEVAIKLNGERVADRIPYRGRNLLPGQYVVELQKTGFQTWRQTFWLSPGQVGLITDPTLIANQPLITTVESFLETTALESLDFGLELSRGEFTDGGEFVTRFAEIPWQIHRYNDYYLYQVGHELRLFLSRGTQDYLIYRAESQAKLPLTLYPSTWQVVVRDGTALKLINLIIPGSNALK